MAKRIRKPVNELKPEDFESWPCWEYALDEEGREGQDETTVRPLARLPARRGEFDQYIVLGAFFFPNGRIRQGTLTLTSGNDIGDLQPVLMVDGKTVPFYAGGLELTRPEKARIRKRLVRISSPIFPIYFTSALRNAKGVPLAAGRLDGLYAYGGFERKARRIKL
jgi:hypothetical protein